MKFLGLFLLVGLFMISFASAELDENCYQETANISTSCGGLETGSYDNFSLLFDGNQTTYTELAPSGGIEYYVNYTKPSYANSSSTWGVNRRIFTPANQSFSYTLPLDCWDAYDDKLSFKLNQSSSGAFVTGAGYCWNGVDWLDNRLFNDKDYTGIFEEWMVWIGYNEDTTYNNETVEGITETFTINFSDNDAVSSIDLVWNNTPYSTTLDNSDFPNVTASRDLVIPSVDEDVNITFYWNVTFSDGGFIETDSYNQTILNINLSSCGVGTTILLNYTLLDEDTDTLIPTNLNGTIYVTVDIKSLDLNTIITSSSQSFTNINNASICINDEVINNTNHALFSSAQYLANGYSTEFHHIQNQSLNNESLYNNITLYDLNLTRATVFKLIFKDPTFLPITDAIIQINRQYLQEGVFKSVESPKTSSLGETSASLVKDSEVYNFVVTKNGEILATFNNQIPFCDDSTIGLCFITFNELSSSGQAFDYNDEIGISTAFDYNATTRVIQFDFTVTDGTSKNVTLVVDKLDQIGNTNVCNTALTSSSGTINCNIPNAIGNGTVYAYVYVDGELVLNQVISLSEDIDLGNAGYFILLIFVIVLPMLFVESKSLSVVAMVLGFMVSTWFGILQGGVLSYASSVIWLIIAGGILIYKINTDKDG